MNAYPFQMNLLLAWLWILLGFLAGLVLGLNFHREDWLGGYGSFPRRMCRLGHISFFGLGMVNLLFYFTVRLLFLSGNMLALSSWAFATGAVTMPICCFTIALRPKLRLLVAVPILSLITGGLTMTCKMITL